MPRPRPAPLVSQFIGVHFVLVMIMSKLMTVIMMIMVGDITKFEGVAWRGGFV